jgi:oligopeptide transport system substrate-binding protein
MKLVRCLSLAILLLVTGSVAWAANNAAVDAQNRSISLALSGEPPSLSSLTAQDQLSFLILGHVKEGLMRYNERGELAGGVAYKWTLTENSARFLLRWSARWNDGELVTAEDFVHGWQRALAPETGSGYAYLLYPIKNAERVNRGELPPSALGVKVVNSHELVVELERPCPYFLALTAFVTYQPVRRSDTEKFDSRYAADADTQSYNGAFQLTRWVHGAKLTLKKNPRYWDARHIYLDTINIDHITSDPSALINLFADGDIAMADITVDNMDQAMARSMPLQQFDTGYLYFLRFNFREDRLTRDYDLRRAIQLVYDADEMVNKVLGLPGFKPAHSLYPAFLQSIGVNLRERYPLIPVTPNLVQAREHMQRFMQRHDLKTPPALVLLAGDSPGSSKQAEYLQNLLQLALNIPVKIDRQIFKQRLAKENAGEFDLVMSGWGPDFDDAMTYADLFASWNPNNRGRYVSKEYDRWLETAAQSMDPAARAAAFNEIQMLVQKEVVILPQWESAMLYVQHPQLRGVVRNRIGADPLFHFARVDPPAPANPPREKAAEANH